MKKEMRAIDAFFEATKWFRDGENVGVWQFQERIEELRGKRVMEGTVTRYMRKCNAGGLDKYIPLRFAFVKNGVYQIQKW